MKQWQDPAYCDLRLGFEVTAYVYVRWGTQWRPVLVTGRNYLII